MGEKGDRCYVYNWQETKFQSNSWHSTADTVSMNLSPVYCGKVLLVSHQIPKQLKIFTITFHN
jgi:hypothetical protein